MSVLVECVCAKLKPDEARFSRIGMQLLICSQAEQEKLLLALHLHFFVLFQASLNPTIAQLLLCPSDV